MNNPTPALILFGIVLATTGTMETQEQRDKFDYCLKAGTFITDSDIEQRIQECEYKTGYTMPDNLRP